MRDAPPSQAPPEATPPGPAGAAAWQARLFDFAIAELVRQHRESFAPLWTVESWAKLLIWLALNGGCATDQASLERFAAGLGSTLSGRMRRLFFERELEDLHVRLLADPAEDQALVVPLDPHGPLPEPPQLLEALQRVGLAGRVAPPERWQPHAALIALPWREEAPACG